MPTAEGMTFRALSKHQATRRIGPHDAVTEPIPLKSTCKKDLCLHLSKTISFLVIHNDQHNTDAAVNNQ
jgi:hypothetical protein